ncbi:MAG: extracellular solute-binding protein [Chloroflexota bacterium]
MNLRPSLARLFLLICLACAACSSPAAGPTPAPSAILPPTATTVPTPLPPAPTPTEQAVRGTLSIRHSWSEAELPALVQIIDSFRLKHPEVYFDVLYIPANELRGRFEMDSRAGQGPALLLGPAEWGPALYDQGLVADLNGRLDPALSGELNAPALNALRYGEALVGLPYSMEGVVLFRNKEIMTISPPSLKELTALAQTTTQGDVLGAYLERSFFFSGAHLDGLGGQLMDAQGQPAFAGPAGLAWIELLRSFEQAGPPDYLSDEDLSRFQEGQVGWIIDGTWNLRPLAAGIGPENLAIDPWPAAGSGRMAGYVVPQAIYVNAAAAEAQQFTALAFIAHLLSPEAQSLLAEAGRIPVTQQASLSDPVMGPLVKQALTALAGGAAYPNTPAMAVYAQNLDLALRAIFADGADPAQALQSAADAIRSALAATQLTPTP